MALQINTNVAALNAQRNLAITNNKLGSLFEQLSSGQRVNRAADDAAGLAISEKMRAQIRGMQQGQRNAQDGISMLQTTEGALNEVHSILQRVRELAVQAGNTTLSSSDRQAIGEEMLALRSEIDNIGTRTRFNGQQLLNGSLAVSLNAGASSADNVTAAANGATVSVSTIDVGEALGSATYTLASSGANLTLSHDDGTGYVVSQTVTVAAMGANATQALQFDRLGVTIDLTHDANAGNVTAATIAAAFDTTNIDTSASSTASFRVGADTGDSIALAFEDMRASALGDAGKIGTLITDNDAVSTTTKADTLLASVDTAIAQVSTFRAKLGASQNQMEHAVNSVAVSVENLSASESRIRDAEPRDGWRRRCACRRRRARRASSAWRASVSTMRARCSPGRRRPAEVSAQVTGGTRVTLRHDPALVAAFLTVVLLAALFLAPRPVAIVEAPALTLAIADLRGQALLIANSGDPTRARRIALPGGPHELVALPDGRLVVSLEQYGALAVVDPATGDVQELRVGGTPHGLALHGGTLYVTDRSVDAIRRFTVGSWQEQAPVASGAMPHIVATTDEGALVIANAADDTVTVGERTVHVSHVPESIAIGAGGVIATAGSIGGALQLFDADGAPLGHYDLGGRPVRLQYDPSGRVLVAALSADGTVAILERGEVRRIAVGGVPDGLAFSSDGRWLYVSDMYGGAVSVVDLRRSRVVERFAPGRSAGAILVLPR